MRTKHVYVGCIDADGHLPVEEFLAQVAEQVMSVPEEFRANVVVLLNAPLDMAYTRPLTAEEVQAEEEATAASDRMYLEYRRKKWVELNKEFGS